jgi:hypothetical protein
MTRFLERRNAVYTAVGLGLALMGISLGVEATYLLSHTLFWTGASICLLAAVVAYGQGARAMADGKDRSIHVGNVSSVNQSGGITAGVYVGNPPRTLGDNFKAELLRKLPKGKAVEISKCVGIADAAALTEEIATFLRANGYTLLPVADVLGMQLKGVAIWEHTDPPQIIVGDR